MCKQKINNRYEWIDVAKGISILLVMWGHVVVIHDALYNWVTSFHVPVFLVITGFLLSVTKKQTSSFKKTFEKIIRPYWVFSLISIVTDVGCSYYSGGGTAAVNSFLIDCYKVISCYGIHALWYLSSYLIAMWIYLYLLKDLKSLRLLSFVIVSFGMGIALSEGNKYFIQLFPSKVFYLVNFPVTALVRAVVCAALIAIGHYVYLFLRFSRIINGLLGGTLLAFSFLISLVSDSSNFSIVDYGKHPILFLFVAISGAVGLLLILRSFECRWSIFQYFGRNSLLFLVTHHSLKITYLSVAITKLFISGENGAFGLIALCILVSIDSLIVELIKHKFPLMIYVNNDV